MSLLQRFGPLLLLHERQRASERGSFADEAVPAPDVARSAFPGGPFAQLVTRPPEAADAAYAAFVRHELTPGVAERDVTLALADADASCPAIERLAGYRFEVERERSYTGRRRLFVRYLVRLQYIHEANLRTLRDLRRARTARRVTVLPGCCPICDAIASRPHRLSHPPALPVAGCVRHGGCICGYVPVIE
jgi:hypothetical protein